MSSWTRREVMKAGAAAGLTAGMSQAVRAQQSNKTIGVGWIGVGSRGTEVLNRILDVEGHKVVAVCDIDEEALQRARELVKEKQGHLPEGYSKGPDDFLNLLDRDDVDAVGVATPCYEHARMFLAALKRDKHVYGEKPMGLTIKELNAVTLAASQRPNVVFQVGFQWMAHPTMLDALDRIHKGEIGRVIEGRFHRHNSKYFAGGWFGRREQSGDWMLEQNVHEFNIMNLVAKSTPIRAYGLGRGDIFTKRQPERNVTDYYTTIVEFPTGFSVHYNLSWLTPEPWAGRQMRVVGLDGIIDIEQGEMHLHDKEKKVKPIKKLEGSDTDRAVAAFIDSIQNNKPSIAPAGMGRNAVLTAMLIRKAVYERRVVTWGEMLRTC
jgi:predicted dehydrogenase